MAQKVQPQSALPVLMIGAVLVFGLGSAAMVLSKSDATPQTEAVRQASQDSFVASTGADKAAGAAQEPVPLPSATSAAGDAVAEPPSDEPIPPVAPKTRSVFPHPSPNRLTPQQIERFVKLLTPTPTPDAAPAPVEVKKQPAQEPKSKASRVVTSSRSTSAEPTRQHPPVVNAPVTPSSRAKPSTPSGIALELPKGGAPSVPLPPMPGTAAAPAVVEAKPIVSPAPPRKSVSPTEPTQTVRAVTAPPLVKVEVKPQVLAATAERAWVKLNDQRTVILNKGEALPGLGTYMGAPDGVAKFQP